MLSGTTAFPLRGSSRARAHCFYASAIYVQRASQTRERKNGRFERGELKLSPRSSLECTRAVSNCIRHARIVPWICRRATSISGFRNVDVSIYSIGIIQQNPPMSNIFSFTNSHTYQNLVRTSKTRKNVLK